MVWLPCLFCKRKRRLFKISTVDSRTGRTIKDYIVQILGSFGSCEEYLYDDDGLCSLCMCFLNNLLYIRNCMFLIISAERGENCYKPFLKFSNVYKHFLENLQKLNYEECENEIDHNTPELLRTDHSSPFEEEHGVDNNLRYGVHSRNGTPYADREVQNVFRGRRGRVKGRRKRRGYNWSRRKSSRPKSNVSTYSEPIPRRKWTHLSTTNFSEYQSSDSDADNNEELASNSENMDHQNGILTNKRSRFMDGEQDEISMPIAKKYKCLSNCSVEFESLDKLTVHKKEEHGMLAKYVCYECCAPKSFVSPEDLKLHDDVNHSVLISNCCKCSMELRTKEDLRKHLREPHSYSCNYCDMFFVSQENCETHVRENHEGKKKIIRRYKEYTIVDCTYEREDSPVCHPNIDNAYNGQIILRLQRGLCVEKLSKLCLNVIIGFKQGVVDITNLMKTSHDTITLNGDWNTGEINIPEYTHENIVDMQHVMNSDTTLDNSVAEINNSNVNDLSSGIVFEASDVVPDIATEMNVYTSKKGMTTHENVDNSNETTEPEDVILTTNDNFETFMTNIDISGYKKGKTKLEILPENIDVQLLSQSNQYSNIVENLVSCTTSNNNSNLRKEEL